MLNMLKIRRNLEVAKAPHTDKKTTTLNFLVLIFDHEMFKAEEKV